MDHKDASSIALGGDRVGERQPVAGVATALTAEKGGDNVVDRRRFQIGVDA